MTDDTQFLKQMSYYQNSTNLSNLDLLTSIVNNNLQISAAWYQNTDGSWFNVPEYFKPTKSRSFNTQLYINMLDEGESGASAREWVRRTAPFIWNLFLRSRAGKKYRPKNFKRKNKRDYKYKSYTNMDALLERLGLVEDEEPDDTIDGNGPEIIPPVWFRPAGNDASKNAEIYRNLYYNTNNCRDEYRNYTEAETASDPEKKILKDAYYQFLLSEDYYNQENQNDNIGTPPEDIEELKNRILLHKGIEREDYFNTYKDEPPQDTSLLRLVRELYTRTKEKKYNRVKWHLHEYSENELTNGVRLVRNKDGNYSSFYTRGKPARNRPCERCKELDGTDYTLSEFILDKVRNVSKYSGSPIYDYSHPGCNCYLELYRVFEDGEPNAGQRDTSVKPLYINALGASYNIKKVLEPVPDQVVEAKENEVNKE